MNPVSAEGKEAYPPLLLLAGPTAVGKTAAAIRLAQQFAGEIISADSRQIYRGMDIGTAKPTATEQAAAPHHLIDIRNPDQEFTLADYVEQASSTIKAITARGRLPILAGGTPLYSYAVTEGWQMPRVAPNPTLRAELEATAQRDGLATLEARLRTVDPRAAARASGNQRRIIRALEVYTLTGQPMSSQEQKNPPPYRILPIILTLPRPTLHARADARVDKMLAAGLVAEVQGLLDQGYDPALSALTGIGYAEIIRHLHGEISLDTARTQIITNTHRYIRHQETWFRRHRSAIRLAVDQPGWEDSLHDQVATFLKSAD